jgi:carbon storage regulator CsrA
MLVIGRKQEQKVIITASNGQEIELMICAVNGNQVRIGFTADKSVIIDREEVAKAKFMLSE